MKGNPSHLFLEEIEGKVGMEPGVARKLIRDLGLELVVRKMGVARRGRCECVLLDLVEAGPQLPVVCRQGAESGFEGFEAKSVRFG